MTCMAELFYPAVDHAHELPGRDLSADRHTLQSVPAILPELLPVQTVSLAGGIQDVYKRQALLTPFYSVTPYVGAAFCFKSFILSLIHI